MFIVRARDFVLEGFFPEESCPYPVLPRHFYCQPLGVILLYCKCRTLRKVITYPLAPCPCFHALLLLVRLLKSGMFHTTVWLHRDLGQTAKYNNI